MPQLELSPAAQHWVMVVLVWIGYGTLAGLVAMLILPLKHPAGPIATLLLGIVGSVIGLFALTWYFQEKPVSPISPLGFLSATAGAFLLLILYRGWQACFHRKKENEESSDS
jgi:uncharacterized membrane protein YeaQ/YmgE (transglycosylase-associated protein family)